MELDESMYQRVESEYEFAISQLGDPLCRKLQHYLERIRDYWRPLPDLSFLPQGEPLSNFCLSPMWHFRIAPSGHDVELIGRFLGAETLQNCIVAAKTLKFAVPFEDSAISMLRQAAVLADSPLTLAVEDSIESLLEADPNDPKWRTRRVW